MSTALVELKGEKLDLDDLQTIMNGSDWDIVCEEDRYYLTSPALDKHSDKRDIIRVAKQHIDTLNGIANIIHHDHQNIQVGDLKTPTDSAQQPFSMVTDRVASGQQENEQETEFVKVCLTKAAAEDNVLKAIRLFNEITWSDLYSIYEIINRAVGGQNNLYRFAEKNRINDFIKMAQYSRQPKPTGKKPENPFTLFQGHRLMKELFRKWIAQQKDSAPGARPARAES